MASIIAVLYEERRENALSIPYFREAVEYHSSQNNSLDLSIALYGLGRALVYVGDIEEGRSHLQKSAEISQKIITELV